MSRYRTIGVGILLLAAAGPAHAQLAGGPVAAARFETWRPAGAVAPAPSVTRVAPDHPHRARNGLIGGAIGAAAGVIGCTVISSLTNDSAEGGLSFCPWDSYLLIGGAGFALGFGVGWLI